MAIGAIVSAAVGFCFPWSCAVCAAGYEGRGPLCPTCDAELAALEGEPNCRACALPLPMHGSPCPYCRGKGPPNFDRVVRLTAYHDPARVLIHHLKYHRRWGVAEELADRLLALERVKEVMHDTDVLVPVPLHWRRQLTRGYNQAEVIARRLGKRCEKPVLRPVRRTRNTETQTHLFNPTRRAENLKDAFVLRNGRGVTGKHVTLVDDVWTSGATLQTLARVLKQAKPASLSAIVVAVADPRGIERPEKPTARE